MRSRLRLSIWSVLDVVVLKLWPILLLSLVPVVPPTIQPTSNYLVLVVDKSHSLNDMSGLVNSVALGLPQGAGDDLKLRIVAFGDTAASWPWKDGKPVWLELPDLDGIKRAEKWLRQVDVGISTKHESAFRAFSHRIKGLNIAIVTDGGFNSQLAVVLASMQDWQEKREKAGYGKALVSIIGIGVKNTPVLVTLAQEGQGGYYVWEKD